LTERTYRIILLGKEGIAVIGKRNLQAFLKSFRNIGKGIINVKTIKNVSLNNCLNALIALVFLNKTPSGSEGHFLEVYEGNLIPILTKPALQCSFDKSAELIGCRVRDNRLMSEDRLKIFSALLKASKPYGANKARKVLHILCNDNVVFTLHLPLKLSEVMPR